MEKHLIGIGEYLKNTYTKNIFTKSIAITNIAKHTFNLFGSDSKKHFFPLKVI